MEVAGKRKDDDTVSEFCEPCQEGNISTQADGYCNDCEEYMCQTCFQSHVKMKLGRNHVLGAVNASRKQGTQSQAEKCKKHKTENIKYYCRNHDSVACGDCLLFDHRKCEPEPEFIRDLAMNIEVSSDFKNILKEVDNLADFKAEVEFALGRNRKDNTECHEKAIQEIQKCRAEINTWLDNVTSQIEAEEMGIWKKNEIILSNLEGWINIIGDKIDEVRDEISTEKFTGENLFIRVIECKSKLSDFVTKRVPEIKSNLDIKPFAFEPNQKLFAFTKSANLGLIKLGGGNKELQTSNVEQQGASNVASFNLTGQPEAENVEICESGILKRSEDSVRAELEKELEQIRQTIILEKELRENLEKECITLKNELEDQAILLSREREEREKCINKTNELENTIVLLKQENNSINDLNTSLKSQLDSCKKEFERLQHSSKARHEQDNTKMHSLKLELKKISESHEKERESLSSQIRELQRQMESAQKTYQLPDPRAAGFDVGKRVQCTVGPLNGWNGTVTAVDRSGFIDMKFDGGGSRRYKAGAGGKYDVKLL